MNYNLEKKSYISLNGVWRNVFSNNAFIPSVIIALLFAVGQIAVSGFASLNNIANVMTVACIIATVTISQMFVMIIGKDDIDLSVGAVMSMSALTLAKLCGPDPANLPWSLLAVVLMGALVGLINFCGISFLKIPSMIMTMIMGTVLNGFNYFYTKGIVSGDIPDILLQLGRQVYGPFKTIFFVGVVIFIAVYLFLKKMKTGKLMFLVGSNRNAAALCGAKTERITLLAYMISGIMAALAGVLLLGYSGAAVLKMGDDFVMMSITAAVIGGIKAGEGKVIGCYLGAIIIQLLTNVLIAANLSDSIRIFIQGVVLLAILCTFARRPKIQQ